MKALMMHKAVFNGMIQGHNHCFRHCLASGRCVRRFFAPSIRHRAYGTRYGDAARSTLINGLNKVADAVKVR